MAHPEKVFCGFGDCGRPCIAPHTREAGRCWKHPLVVAAVTHIENLTGPTRSAPVVMPAPKRPAYPIIEIPDTQDGWVDVERELAARLMVMAQTWQVRLACRGGEVWVDISQSSPGVPLLKVRGGVSLGWGQYTVYGPPGYVQVQNGDTGYGGPATLKRAARVRLAVAIAWEAPGAHAALRETYMAYQAACRCVNSYGEPARPGEGRIAEWALADGRRTLLVLAAGALQGKARDAVDALIEGGYVGGVQDMLDAVAAMAAEPPRR